MENNSNTQYRKPRDILESHVAMFRDIDDIERSNPGIYFMPHHYDKFTWWERLKTKIWNFILPPHIRLREYKDELNLDSDIWFENNAYIRAAELAPPKEES